MAHAATAEPAIAVRMTTVASLFAATALSQSRWGLGRRA
jgi:hypothetical protein